MGLCLIRIKFVDMCNSYNLNIYNFKVLNEKKIIIYSKYCDMSDDNFYISLSYYYYNLCFLTCPIFYLAY